MTAQHVDPSIAVSRQAEPSAGAVASVARPVARPVWAVEAALWLGIVALGVLVRWPNLWLIPTFTDETGEALRAIAIYRGEIAPLTNVDGYIGAFWNYAIAGGFWLFGLSPWLPRLLAFVVGVLTVGAACWLGRELGGRIGGLTAGLFMAACSTHALVNSHVGWSHSTTPLWATLGLACLARALGSSPAGATLPSSDGVAGSPSPHPLPPGERALALSPGGRGWGEGEAYGIIDPWLVGAGLLLGLAVQTHVTALLLLPGAAFAVLVARPGLVRTRWAALAGLAFLVATANLIVYNVDSGGGSLLAGRAKLAGYTGEDDGLDGDNYVENVGRMVLASSWVLSGAIEKRRFVNETLADPLLLLYLGVALGGMAWAAWRGRWLPVLVAVPYLLVLPLLHAKYEPMLNGRYLVPVLPLVFAAIGLAASDAWTTLRVRLPSTTPALGVLLAATLAGLALYPLLPMQRYVQSARTNHAILAAYDTVLASRAPNETVLLDYGLDGVFFMAAGSAFKSLELLLSGSNVPYVVIDARAASIEEALGSGDARLTVLNADKVAPLRRSFAVTALMPGEGRGGPGFGVYRVAPRR